MTVVAYDFAIVVDVDWAHKTPRKLKLIELQSALTNAEALPNTRTDRQAGQSHTHTHSVPSGVRSYTWPLSQSLSTS